MRRPLSALLRRTLRAVTALALGFGLYWAVEQVMLSSGNRSLETVAVWLSPITIFGWAALVAFVVLAAILTRRLWPQRPPARIAAQPKAEGGHSAASADADPAFILAARRIKRGDVAGLKRLLREGLSPNATNKYGWSLLMLAALRGTTRIGIALMEAGAEVNAVNSFGETPLSLAVCAGHVEFTKALLKRGASRDCRPHGRDLKDWAISFSGLPAKRLNRVLPLIDPSFEPLLISVFDQPGFD